MGASPWGKLARQIAIPECLANEFKPEGLMEVDAPVSVPK
jgi:hypothetical protein